LIRINLGNLKSINLRLIRNLNFTKTTSKNIFKIGNRKKNGNCPRKNTRKMSKNKIEELKKQYQSPPTTDYIDDFFFVFKNLDFIMVDY